MISHERFIEIGRVKVADIEATYGREVATEDVFVVWACKTLQNSKALMSTPVKNAMYYELTYNGDKNEIYCDAYKKELHEVI